MPARGLPGQLELAGCGHEPSRLLLQRRAAAPLAPSKPQRPSDFGLFGGATAQIDLEDLTRAAARYATDGKCHNAEPGTFGHECGRPAVWIGRKANGYRSGFCAACREHGSEARAFVSWERA